LSLTGALKKPVSDRLSEPGNNPQSALQRADVLTKTAFLASRLVLVNEAFSDRPVDDRHSLLVGGLGGDSVASGKRRS